MGGEKGGVSCPWYDAFAKERGKRWRRVAHPASWVVVGEERGRSFGGSLLAFGRRGSGRRSGAQEAVGRARRGAVEEMRQRHWVDARGEVEGGKKGGRGEGGPRSGGLSLSRAQSEARQRGQPWPQPPTRDQAGRGRGTYSCPCPSPSKGPTLQEMPSRARRGEATCGEGVGRPALSRSKTDGGWRRSSAEVGERGRGNRGDRRRQDLPGCVGAERPR